MIPIAITSYERLVYLDTTLKSLSATDIPAKTSVTVFDDGSTSTAKRDYFFGTGQVRVNSNGSVHSWPTHNVEWQRRGLSHLPETRVIDSITGRVNLFTRSGSVGVVNHSNEAITRTFASYPKVEWMILLQDDVVFNVDWFYNLTLAIDHNAGDYRDQAIIAGMTLNDRETPYHNSIENVNFATAQCYLINRDFFEAAQGWFSTKHNDREEWDVQVCTLARDMGYAVHLVNPYVCQHIGLTSAVYSRALNRYPFGHHAHPPFVSAKAVRKFV